MADKHLGDALFNWQDRLQSGRNRLGFGLRNFLRWVPGDYRELAAQPESLWIGSTETDDPVNSLLDTYGLAPIINTMSRERCLETLTYLAWLDQAYSQWPAAFEPVFSQASPLRWLDAGAKNWAYVQALAAFIRVRHTGRFRLDGVELDPNRRYSNLQTRRQAALAFSRDIQEATYHEGDLLAWEQPVDVISHFLPFVFKEPHLAWGLPLDYFNPQAMLNHLLGLLRPGALMIIVNQGAVEAEAQAELLQRASRQVRVQWKSLGQLSARFIEYRYPRYGWLCMKGGDETHERNRTEADHYPGLQE